VGSGVEDRIGAKNGRSTYINAGIGWVGKWGLIAWGLIADRHDWKSPVWFYVFVPPGSPRPLQFPRNHRRTPMTAPRNSMMGVRPLNAFFTRSIDENSRASGVFKSSRPAPAPPTPLAATKKRILGSTSFPHKAVAVGLARVFQAWTICTLLNLGEWTTYVFVALAAVCVAAFGE
jgi:hypothetical protein